MEKTERDNLVKRINRALAKKDRKLVITRPGNHRMDSKLGSAYIVNMKTDSVWKKNIDIEALGHELGVMAKAAAAGAGSKERRKESRFETLPVGSDRTPEVEIEEEEEGELQPC